uniref:TRACeR-I n=1 Tax=Homo sapiens TaxID=9606 RepID=UPI00383BF712
MDKEIAKEIFNMMFMLLWRVFRSQRIDANNVELIKFNIRVLDWIMAEADNDLCYFIGTHDKCENPKEQWVANYQNLNNVVFTNKELEDIYDLSNKEETKEVLKKFKEKVNQFYRHAFDIINKYGLEHHHHHH